ncbi:hypothetical protein [Bordetella genomosp. 13]|nr:hypothetical protein [Bordetella genomosp. 13]
MFLTSLWIDPEHLHPGDEGARVKSKIVRARLYRKHVEILAASP